MLKELINLLKSIYRFLSPKWQNAFLDYKVNLEPRYHKNGKFEANPFLTSLFEKNISKFSSVLNSFLQYEEQIDSIGLKPQNKTDPYWQNDFLPGLDMIAIYGMIRELKPSIYLEIGSGHSTRIAFKAKREGDLTTKIISIDPFPRSEIDHLADQIIRKPVEGMSFNDDVFSQLKSGDILFIDSSHRILPNSDCAFIYNELIPSLPKGVFIHIHDIYLPYDYPQFMCDRLYNENEFLAAYLLSNPNYFKILLPNFYVYKNPDFWNTIAPLFTSSKMKDVEKHGGSIWLSKN